MGEPRAGGMAIEWGSDLGNPLALLDVEPDEIDPAVGLVFVQGHDDLDAARVATFRAPSGRDYAFVRHARSPVPGTEILTKASLADASSIAADVMRMLATLRLRETAITWLAPIVAAAARTAAAADTPSVAPRRQRRK